MKLLREDQGYRYDGLTTDGLFRFYTPYNDIVAYQSVKFLLKDGTVLFGDVGDSEIHPSKLQQSEKTR